MIKNVLKALRANILIGFFLTIPIVATILIFNFLFKLATDWLPKGHIPEYVVNYGKGYPLRVATLIAVLAALYLVGFLARCLIGRKLYQLGDRFITHIPVVKNIYIAIRQVSEALFTQRKTLFKEVVLIQYPRKGLYSLAFVTAEVPALLSIHMQSDSSDCISLFIPTTPNPTSGLIILVPRSETILLEISVTAALTYVMSAGAVRPGSEQTDTSTMLDRLELWLKQGEESGDPPSPRLRRTSRSQ